MLLQWYMNLSDCLPIVHRSVPEVGNSSCICALNRTCHYKWIQNEETMGSTNRITRSISNNR